MINRYKTAKASADQDDIFSYYEAEETEENYMHKKQLIHLENDKSVTIEDSLLDEERDLRESNSILDSNRERTPRNYFAPIAHRNKIPNSDLLKFISDSTEFNYDWNKKQSEHNNYNYNNYNTTQQQQHEFSSGNKNEINTRTQEPLSVEKFSLNINMNSSFTSKSDRKEGDKKSHANQSHNITQKFLNDKEKLFTLQSLQSNSSNSLRYSNHFKENHEILENKNKELAESLENSQISIKEWQLFYIKLFNILNLPIPLTEGYESIFNESYKKIIIDSVEEFSLNFEEEKKINEYRENLEIKRQMTKYNHVIRAEARFEIKNEKSLRKINFSIDSKKIIFSYSPSSIQTKFHNEIFFRKINAIEFSIIKEYEKENSHANNSNFLEIQKIYTKQITHEEDINIMAPFSTRNILNKSTKKNANQEIFLNNNKINLSIENSKNFQIISKIENNSNYTVTNPPHILYLQSENFFFDIFPLKTQKKNLKFSQTQTDLHSSEIEKTKVINEEYSTQLILNKNEKIKLETYHKLHSDNLKEEIKHLNNIISAHINDSKEEDTLTNMHPEMIPPEHTLKIFLHFIRHLKYEEEMYVNKVKISDLKSIKSFVEKTEKFLFKGNENIAKSTEVKKYIADGKLETSIRKINSRNSLNINDSSQYDSDLKFNSLTGNHVYSKYKSMLKSMINSNRNSQMK